MIVNRDVLLCFLKKHSISGDFANDELILNIRKDKIEILTVSNGKHVVINGQLKGVFEDIGEIALDKVSNLISLISNFSSKEISISKKDNKLIIESDEDKTKATFTLKNPEYILNKISGSKLKELLDKASENKVTLSKEIVLKIISTANAVKADNISLKLKEKSLVIEVDNGSQSIETYFELKEIAKPVSLKLNKAIVDIFKLLEEESTLSVNVDSPVLLTVTNKAFHIHYIVATLKK